jgi:glucosamine--fructose-6-phosphate aminotransferase (isomerizing)
MVLAMRILAFSLGQRRGRISATETKNVVASLRALPAFMDHAVDAKAAVEALAGRYYEASNFIFIGRGTSFGIALEGALKLKEISYIHAEGYAGGELKHGPIALIDRHMPVVAVVPQDSYHEKMISNVEEVRAREGQIIGVGGAYDEKLQGVSSDFIACPQVDDIALQAILSVVPLQLLSYYIAVKRGTDVDQPRNLAKSVTVE